MIGLPPLLELSQLQVNLDRQFATVKIDDQLSQQRLAQLNLLPTHLLIRKRLSFWAIFVGLIT